MHYHIVGIAGAGMSAIAQVLLDQGHSVSGSDTQQNALVEALEQRGVVVRLGHDREHIAGAEALIATSAVKPDHVELLAARARGIPVLKRADLWREWSRSRSIVAVAGTHGKTTTTALIALALTQAGLNPGFLVGGEVPELGTNARWGDPVAPLVIEADEYDRTFLALTPNIAVITNVEWDHVDIYPTPADYNAAFHEFARLVEEPRNLIVCGDDQAAVEALDQPRATQYGIDETIATDPASCRLAPLDWMASNVRTEGALTYFDIWRYDPATFGTRLVGSQSIRLAGMHNVRNALAALAACAALGVNPHAVSEALARYSGAKRRFEHKGDSAGIVVIDDYAHHPTEVRVNLAAARARYPGRRIVVYIQPHTYSRTRALLEQWADAFGDADVVRIGEIYAARESDTLGVSARSMAGWIEHPDIEATGNLKQAASDLLALLRDGDVLLTMGAGDSYQVGELVLAELKKRPQPVN